MQRLFGVPFNITAVSFDRSGRLIPKRIDCAGRSYSLQPSLKGDMYGFQHGGRYYWIERQSKSWHWVYPSTN